MTNITGKIEITPIIGEMSTHYEYVEPLYIDALLKTVIKETTLFTAYPDKMTIETSSGKLRNYIIWGNNTGDYDIETGKYKVPVTVRKINHFDPTSTVVELYPDTDGVVKAATSAKQRSVIVEVDPGTYYTVYINSGNNLMGHVAGYSTVPVAGSTALWTDMDTEQLSPRVNKFYADEDTHYIMIYISYGSNDISDILPYVRLIKGSTDFNNTVTFELNAPLGVGQAIRYDETETGISTPTYGDCEITVDTDNQPFDVWIEYDTKEVPQYVQT